MPFKAYINVFLILTGIALYCSSFNVMVSRGVILRQQILTPLYYKTLLRQSLLLRKSYYLLVNDDCESWFSQIYSVWGSTILCYTAQRMLFWRIFLISQQTRDVVSTSIRPLYDVDDVAQTLKRRRVSTGFGFSSDKFYGTFKYARSYPVFRSSRSVLGLKMLINGFHSIFPFLSSKPKI